MSDAHQERFLLVFVGKLNGATHIRTGDLTGVVQFVVNVDLLVPTVSGTYRDRIMKDAFTVFFIIGAFFINADVSRIFNGNRGRAAGEGDRAAISDFVGFYLGAQGEMTGKGWCGAKLLLNFKVIVPSFATVIVPTPSSRS